MHFKVPHTTTQAEAVQKVKKALEEARPHFKDEAAINEERWEGDIFHFDVTLKGKSIIGTLEVTDADFIFDAKLPLMWRMFEGMIEKEMAKQVQALQ